MMPTSSSVPLTSLGLSRRRLVRVNGRQTGFGSVMMITYAANALSISVPFAGAELAMVFSYRQFRRHGVDATTAGWTLAVSAIFSTSALAYRLVNFWLVLVAGWILMAILAHRSGPRTARG
jgi:uncharacterized membrane protein YbhN (UPF0104 family)